MPESPIEEKPRGMGSRAPSHGRSPHLLESRILEGSAHAANQCAASWRPRAPRRLGLRLRSQHEHPSGAERVPASRADSAHAAPTGSAACWEDVAQIDGGRCEPTWLAAASTHQHPRWVRERCPLRRSTHHVDASVAARRRCFRPQAATGSSRVGSRLPDRSGRAAPRRPRHPRCSYAEPPEGRCWRLPRRRGSRPLRGRPDRNSDRRRHARFPRGEGILLGALTRAPRGSVQIAYQVAGEGPLDVLIVPRWFCSTGTCRPWRGFSRGWARSRV